MTTKEDGKAVKKLKGKQVLEKLEAEAVKRENDPYPESVSFNFYAGASMLLVALVEQGFLTQRQATYLDVGFFKSLCTVRYASKKRTVYTDKLPVEVTDLYHRGTHYLNSLYYEPEAAAPAKVEAASATV